MPHSIFKGRPLWPGLGVAKCLCGQTFNYESDRERNMKMQMHHKVCLWLVKGVDRVRVPNEAMVLSELQHNEAERRRRVHEHHWEEEMPIILWQLCVFRDEHQLFLHKHSLQSILHMDHHSITATRCDIAQPVGSLTPSSIHGSLALIFLFFSELQEVPI